MKPKTDYKQKALAKSPTLVEEKEGDEVKILLKTRSGVHTISRAKDSQGAWMNAAKYYGV